MLLVKTMNEMAQNLIEIMVSADEDVILARQKIRTIATEMGFSLLDQTRIVTAVSELARNMVIHAGQGTIRAETLTSPSGLRMIFSDQGPGIQHLDRVLQGGFSTVGSLGLGLSGSKRLMDEFEIQTSPDNGTTITVVKWLPEY